MWIYIRNKEDYTIKYTNENCEKMCSFRLPFKQETRYTIMYWTEKRVQTFINELNNGNITFETPTFTNIDTQEQIIFKITNTSKDDWKMNKIHKGRIKPL